MRTRVEEDVPCPSCGCLCDDLVVEIEDDKIKNVRHACRLGASKLMGHKRIRTPMIKKNGKLEEVSYQEAYDRVAQILVNAKRPLLYGWASTVCEAQKKGVLLTEMVGGILDSTATVCHGPSILGIEERGMSGATLGQIKNRADLIVFWGCNPAETHPKHGLRNSPTICGFFTPEGRKGRRILVVDVRHTRTARYADKAVMISPGSDFEVLSALRMFVAGKGEFVPAVVGGVPKAQLSEAADMMKAAKFGAFFFGLGITHSRGRSKNVGNALALIAELNAHTKFVVMPMRGHYNVAGISQVAAWETGFPMSIDFSRGTAYFNPGETAACDVLSREDTDAVMVVASDPASNFPRGIVENLAKVPVIQIDPYETPTTLLAEVVIPSAIAGVECEGTAYRMDGVALRMKKLVNSPYPSDEEILNGIIESVRKLKGAQAKAPGEVAA